MLAQIASAGVRGVDSFAVQVEVNVSSGLPGFTVVGLPEGAVREGRERVMAALHNAGAPVPPRRITVNLAPADVRKEGSAFDLPIAVGVLAGCGRLPPQVGRGAAFVGELGLDGALRPLRGAVAIALGVRSWGVGILYLPMANAPEASVVEGLDVRGARTLSEMLAHLEGRAELGVIRRPVAAVLAGPPSLDLADVRGQDQAKRALEISAAGAHNMLLIGPPGSGKTMLARRLPGILPPMTPDEALEVTRIHSVAGLLQPGQGLVSHRPFRAPHHSVSEAGLIGGGGSPRPGEASLASHGVLFLDELPEFRRGVLEALRQPLEDRQIVLSRARFSVTFPAHFVLVAAMNPCPCGFLGDGTDRCLCDDSVLRRYRARVSGPLLDRMDLHLEMPAVPYRTLGSADPVESSRDVGDRVERCRRVQRTRFRESPNVHANGQMTPSQLRAHCRLDPGVAHLLQKAVDGLGLSARAYHRAIKVARTIADLDGAGQIARRHAAEAIQYRTLDRRPSGRPPY